MDHEINVILWTKNCMELYTVGNGTMYIMRGVVDGAEANLGGLIPEGLFSVSF